ncbi:hypothetical protein AWM68_01940 [Fictibacillus phosphorivorans]|uniref:Lipoprotein n=1 Tax=Fictibacillus phosphorivorans TaxID=1221500 RepID=A0A161TRN7_9BACL|nr:hypothetical protein [Fictibacillus phosphorivorans]KZE69051.1 hypothetical protein AWM68_01940 [Fictibacillus phosphorivorans]
MKNKILIVFSVLLLSSCSFGAMHNKNLEQSIHSVMKDEGKLNLNKIAEFEWDEAHLFPPYTSQSEINKQLGFTFKDPSGMKSRDDIFLLLFLDNHKVVQYVEVSREYGELIPKNHQPVTPSSSSFKVKRVN